MPSKTALALPVCHSFRNSQTKIHEITHHYSAKITLWLNNMQHIKKKIKKNHLLILAKRAKLTITKKKTRSPLNTLRPYQFYLTINILYTTVFVLKSIIIVFENICRKAEESNTQVSKSTQQRHYMEPNQHQHTLFLGTMTQPIHTWAQSDITQTSYKTVGRLKSV